MGDPHAGGRGLAPKRHLVAQKTQSQNTLDAESSPLGEDVQRTEEVRCTLCWARLIIQDYYAYGKLQTLLIS